MLNHGSFGAAPTCVLEEQAYWRDRWNSVSDHMFFTGELWQKIRAAASSCIPALTQKGSSLSTQQIALVDNAATAANVIAYRWNKLMRPGDVIFVTDVVYGACRNAFEEHCSSTRSDDDAFLHAESSSLRREVRELKLLTSEGNLAEVDSEASKFPKTQRQMAQRFEHSIMEALREIRLRDSQLNSTCTRRAFFFIDEISSQPSFVLPVAEILIAAHQAISEYNVECSLGSNKVGNIEFGEVCIDGAHSFALPNLDVVHDLLDNSTIPAEARPSWWFANVHKWGFAANTAAVLVARTSELMETTRHPLVSWNWKQGLGQEGVWVGTRDYSALLAVPKAIEYYLNWTDACLDNGLSSSRSSAPEWCRAQCLAAAKRLAKKWGTSDSLPIDDALVCSMAMVELPRDLNVKVNQAGDFSSTGDDLRSVLRREYSVEAGIFTWPGIGSFIRLSYAVYNTPEDIDNLEAAVLDILERQGGRV